MNQRRLILASAAVVLLVAGFLALRWLEDPRQRAIRQVQRRLQDLAKTVSFTDKDPPFVRLGYPGKVEGFFGDPVDFEVTLGSRGAHGPISRAQLREASGAMRAGATGLSVQFLDIVVRLGEDASTAVAHLTAKIYFTGDNDYFVQEFRIELRQKEATWRVFRVETVRTMEQ